MGINTQDSYMKEGNLRKRIKWIDCAKTVAIIAVVVDHCNGFCYRNPIIAQMSYFSVSLFILLSGVSIGLSFPQRRSYLYQLKKCGRIFAQYAIATLIIQAYSQKFLDLKTYILHLVNFDISGPFYFLLFFFQLVLIAPFLMDWYAFCKGQKHSWFWHCITLGLLGYLAYFFIKRTYMLPVHGGGQYLFGGTYLILFYMGILLSGFAGLSLAKNWKSFAIFLLSVGAWIIWPLLRVHGKLPFDRWIVSYWGEGFNPPSIELIAYALITLGMLFLVFTLLDSFQSRIIRKILDILSFCGKNTLYIFMYHLLVRDVLLKCFPVLNSNIWLRRCFVFCPMIIFPVIVVSIIRYCKENIYRGIESSHYCFGNKKREDLTDEA